MPFLDDTEHDETAMHSPLWSVFALVKDNLERLILVNLLWALQIMPALAAIAFPTLWLWIRVLLLLASATALAASTGVLYGLMRAVCEYEPLSLDLVCDTFRTLAVPGMRKLAPLYGTWGLCLIALVLSLASGQFLLQVLIYYLAMLLVACSFYWGPLFVDDPAASLWTLLRRSGQLLWRYPRQTALSGAVILAILATGVASIAGVLLLVPVLVALLQMRRYQQIAGREHSRKMRANARSLERSLA